MIAKKLNGFCFAFEVKETRDKGLGVFAAEPIEQGSIVWRHVPGQYTVYDEPLFKAAIDSMTHDQVVYELTHVFGLKEIPDCLIRVHDEGALINHESAANLETNNAHPIESPFDTKSTHYVEDVTKALLTDRYALIATRDIKRGEEFTNNYVTECYEPEFYEILYELYGVDEGYLDDG
ncbi:MAG: SET domain-containing protein [Pseudomonadota bacterium]